MAKKAKNTVPSIPVIYQKVTRDASRQHHCIVEDVHNAFFRFNTPAENHIVTEAVHKVWPNFNKFADEPKQTILAYHGNMFGAEPPADQDLVTTAINTWFAMCDKATDRTAKTPRTESGRKSTILDRNYFAGEIDGETTVKTPQALACYRLFVKALADSTKTKNIEGKDIKCVSEADLRKHVEANAADLRTRQDPWRIFQYYRPTLIKSKCIKHD